MQTPSSVTTGNNLLAALPQRDRRLLLASGETLDLHYGEVLYEATQRMDRVHFP